MVWLLKLCLRLSVVLHCHCCRLFAVRKGSRWWCCKCDFHRYSTSIDRCPLLYQQGDSTTRYALVVRLIEILTVVTVLTKVNEAISKLSRLKLAPNDLSFSQSGGYAQSLEIAIDAVKKANLKLEKLREKLELREVVCLLFNLDM